jgi:glycosyltransferase involved in cell wall biosynthesis
VKIALVVQGRFHAFDLARALIARDHDVTVFTNYPQFATRRFGLTVRQIRAFPMHGVLSRAAGLDPRISEMSEPKLHKAFGRWAARTLAADAWDIVHCWSGVSEELLEANTVSGVKLLMRGSAHILEQHRLLVEEESRTGTALDRPSAWMCAREVREYGMADHIAVLSSFAAKSFGRWGVPPSRVTSLPLGVDVNAFRSEPEIQDRRRARANRNEPLRVLYVGNVSFRKGWWDLAEALQQLRHRHITTTIVGSVAAEAAPSVERLPPNVSVVGKVPQRDLPRFYRAADVFVFPTIEDGFGLVLAQAKAAGLPIVTTDHSAGADLITNDRDGWLIPIRSADAIVSRLTWCMEHRPELAAMSDDICTHFQARDWSEVAADFEATCHRLQTGEPVAQHA